MHRDPLPLRRRLADDSVVYLGVDVGDCGSCCKKEAYIELRVKLFKQCVCVCVCVCLRTHDFLTSVDAVASGAAFVVGVGGGVVVVVVVVEDVPEPHC